MSISCPLPVILPGETRRSKGQEHPFYRGEEDPVTHLAVLCAQVSPCKTGAHLAVAA